jgi:hypothetical protein
MGACCSSSGQPEPSFSSPETAAVEDSAQQMELAHFYLQGESLQPSEIERLIQLTKPERIRLEGTKSEQALTPTQLTALCGLLRNNKRVHELFLFNQPGAMHDLSALRVLCDMLSFNSGLSRLTLHPLRSAPGEEAGDDATLVGRMVADALQRHWALESLSIQACKLREEELRLIFAALTHNCLKLTELGLSEAADLTGVALDELCTLLRSHHALRHLSLSLCKIHGAPLHQILLALNEHNNPALVWLCLSATRLDDEDAIRLAAVLRVHRSLTSIDLFLNKSIGPAGGAALLEAVQHNPRIMHIDLRNCTGINEQQQEDIRAACERNKTTISEGT